MSLARARFANLGMLSTALTVAFLLLPPFLQSHAGGEGSGGGGTLVCFSDSTDQSQIDNLKVAEPLAKDGTIVDPFRASTMYKVIPDSMLGNIISIESLELVQAKKMASKKMVQKVPELYNPLLLPALNPPVNLETPPTRDLTLLSTAADLYINRFSTNLPQMVASYRFASQILNIESLKPLTPGELEHTIQDFITVTMEPPPKNCVVSSIMVQKGYGLHATWQVDERLFYHPMHTFMSQMTTLLHERAYWMYRAPLVKGDVDANYVGRFVEELLGANTSSFWILQSYQQLVPLGGTLVRDRNNKIGGITAQIKMNK
jgi:hypothetical protein